VLTGLTSTQCPECGRLFDLRDERTFTRKVPFVWWTFWLPPLLVAGIGGPLLALLLVPVFGYGWGVSFVLPAALGVFVGYSVRAGKWVGGGIVALVAAGMVVAIFTAGMTGIFCSAVLAAIFLAPAALGFLVGTVLRSSLRRSNFSQRDHLLPVLILLFPVIWCAIEGRHDGLPLVGVRTVAIIDAPPDAAWDSILFYEEVKHRPPLLLRLPLWRPIRATGDSSHVGGIKVCQYTIGRLVKKIRSIEPNRKLEFDVIEQKKIETEAVRLVGGSFTLEPLDGGKRTKVTLETTYVPLLTPRFAWYPFEAYTVHTLHGHVLEGMRQRAEAKIRDKGENEPKVSGKPTADIRDTP
jgi:hypothetical protein